MTLMARDIIKVLFEYGGEMTEYAFFRELKKECNIPECKHKKEEWCDYRYLLLSALQTAGIIDMWTDEDGVGYYQLDSDVSYTLLQIQRGIIKTKE